MALCAISSKFYIPGFCMRHLGIISWYHHALIANFLIVGILLSPFTKLDPGLLE